MAKSAASRIVREVHDEPHLEGRRVTVRRIQGLVEDAGQSPFEVADELQLDVADVYAALHYYHANSDEMTEIERRRRKRVAEANRADSRSVADYRENRPDDAENSR